jgi:PPOX class probable FMN-dependent enzyme
MTFMTIESVDDLRQIYRPAAGGAVAKVIGALDEHCRDFLAKSPFFVLSTADGDGRCDGSPKGGGPGFVEMLDEHHVAWADYSGNNRLDSFENVVDNARVALLFLIPGLNETLRINGVARLSTDPDLGERFAVDGRPAKVVVVVTVEEAYVHCAKALRRGALWEPESWIDEAGRPNAAAMVKDHARIDVPAEIIEEALARDLEETLWRPGGETT